VALTNDRLHLDSGGLVSTYRVSASVCLQDWIPRARRSTLPPHYYPLLSLSTIICHIPIHGWVVMCTDDRPCRYDQMRGRVCSNPRGPAWHNLQEHGRVPGLWAHGDSQWPRVVHVSGILHLPLNMRCLIALPDNLPRWKLMCGQLQLLV
jgi:hypothetical protein